ncbi:hypothetical protein L2E82_36211 [Cichorium intybus]|uniref:Uncharacterized protein n=1 Tax=Cichorium intybus TaxID=13427 RepID=A0ACB9BQY1_CICIN|nr:hypothetical protein L2E82_36211 [Cichorium intybus]
MDSASKTAYSREDTEEMELQCHKEIEPVFFHLLFLFEEALKAVKELLSETAEGDLASVCSWPDEIKHRWNWQWTSELH